MISQRSFFPGLLCEPLTFLRSEELLQLHVVCGVQLHHETNPVHWADGATTSRSSASGRRPWLNRKLGIYGAGSNPGAEEVEECDVNCNVGRGLGRGLKSQPAMRSRNSLETVPLHPKNL